MATKKALSINSIIDKKNMHEKLNKPLIFIKGVAINEFKNPKNKFGESIGFQGDFTAVNLLTGEMYQDTAIFLPKAITSQIQSRLNTSGIEVEFECTIKAVESDVSPTGYAWVVDAPMTQERINRQAAMALAVKEQVKTLLLTAA